MIVYNEYPTPKALYVALNNTITYNTSNETTKIESQIKDTNTKYYNLEFGDDVTGISINDLRPTEDE